MPNRDAQNAAASPASSGKEKRAFGRRVKPVLAALSLALCVMTIALWGRSYMRSTWQRPIRIHDGAGNDHILLSCERGRIGVSGLSAGDIVRAPWLDDPTEFNDWERFNNSFGPIQWDRAGFIYFSEPIIHNDGRGFLTKIGWQRTAAVPCWFLGVLFALLPARRWGLSILRYRKRKIAWRRERGLCVRCGYDLRSTPQRCPECGAAGEIQRATELLAR